jgi:predicted RNA-binding protein YlxR (DUF448 family)
LLGLQVEGGMCRVVRVAGRVADATGERRGKGWYACPEARCLAKVAKMRGMATAQADNSVGNPAQAVAATAESILQGWLTQRQAGLRRRRIDGTADAVSGAWLMLAERLERARSG